jgi:Immunity protein 22
LQNTAYKCFEKGTHVFYRKVSMLDDNMPGVVSVWIGSTRKSLKQFNAYTKDMEVLGSNSPIQNDLGCLFVDSDWFAAFVAADNQLIAIGELVKEIDCSNATAVLVAERCRALRISESNALYYWVNCTYREGPITRRYNDLQFIGAFADGLKNDT